MAATWTTTAAVAAVLLLLASAFAQDASPPAPSPELATSVPGCFSALMNMSDCLTFVEEGSNLTAPEKSCCPELAGVVERNLTCLCELLSRADSFKVKVDYNRMLQLPSACDISTPPATLCSDVGVPVEVPAADGDPTVPGTSASSPSASPSSNKNGSRSFCYGGVLSLGLITAILLLTLF